jgi:hypothetical protein
VFGSLWIGVRKLEWSSSKHALKVIGFPISKSGLHHLPVEQS